jgi:5-methylcytosine-specific restriction enzyme A
MKALAPRLSPPARGYDWTWRKLRLAILAEEPLCRWCLAEDRLVAATEVHHVIPIAKRPDLRLDRANCVPLCAPCHSAHTRAEQLRGSS